VRYSGFMGYVHSAVWWGTVYGPGMHRAGEAGVIAIFAGRLLTGEGCTIYGDGNQTRDYVFVADTVDAFSRAIDRGSGRLVNIGTGLETSVNMLYRMLAEIAGVDREPEFGPLPSGEVRRIAFDISTAESELGWRPWTHLEDGLGETVAYLKGV
jgi:UDP-glucose 4-epimerase